LQLPIWIRNAAEILATLAVVVVSLTTIFKVKYINRPVKAIYRALVTIPLETWLVSMVEEIVEQKLMRPNHGNSLADIATKQNIVHAEVKNISQKLDHKEKELEIEPNTTG